MTFFSDDSINDKNTFTSLEDGNLFWKKANKKGLIQVPLNLLTKDQIEKLTSYLKSNDLIYNEYFGSNNSRLIWEYWWSTGSEIIVDCIELNHNQRQVLSPPKKSSSQDDNRVRFEINELKSLQESFSSGQAKWKNVFDKLSNLKGKAWSTNSWKEKRESLIKKTCEYCSTTDDKMVLQHTKQPRKPETIFKQYKSTYRNEFEDWLLDNPISIDTSLFPKDTPACPKCDSQTIRYRKTKKNWICVSTIKGIKCGYEFDDPNFQVSSKTINSLKEIALQMKMNEFYETNGLYEKIINECFFDLIEYLSMNHTITLCKKCAYLEDRHRI